MGLGKAMVFGAFAIFPGMFLSLMAYVLIGAPKEQWGGMEDIGMYLACYGPFFSCIAIGFWLGVRDAEPMELE
ncbi:MAG: hypothetical protein QF440_04590 [Candidatus Thalassarchaeaceae archaeon]|jgi:hypothetical protein|nr:hypothetical protein [Candidatus Thalassarchaeaceae archaeon]